MAKVSNDDLQRQITGLAEQNRREHQDLKSILDAIANKLDSGMEKLAAHDAEIANCKEGIAANAGALEAHSNKEFQFSLAILVSFLTGLIGIAVAWFKKN